MKKIITRNQNRISGIKTIFDKLVDVEISLRKLPPLTPLQKAKLDNTRAIDHLYYSSKIEGSHLTNERLERAVYGKIYTSQK